MIRRSAVSIAAAVVIGGAFAPVVGAAALVSEDGPVRSVASSHDRTADESGLNVGASGTVSPCADRAYSLIGGRWSRTYHWAFDYTSTPNSLNASRVEALIVRSVSNITNARNDCGIPDNVSANHVYDGRTTTNPNITRWATCTASDGWNLVGFGRLPEGVLAVTCTNINRRTGIIRGADMLINSRYAWALSTAKCFRQELLEPTVTHEFGHVFGLGHVSERRHPLLTMSTTSDGWCNNEASTLGRGDIRGLEALY